MKREVFNRLLSEKILALDGGMGTSVIERGLPPGRPPEEFNLEKPEQISEIHRGFIEAGADIILSNTFGGSRIKLGEFGLDNKIESINAKAVEIALEAAQGRVLVGASIGPTGRYLPPIGSMEFSTALQAFRQQAKILSDSGVDLIVVETMSDIREMRAALIGIREVFDGPLVAHMTFSDGFTTINGTDPETVVGIIERLDIDAVGVNCSTGPKEIERIVDIVLKTSVLPVSVQPNAGMPTIRDGCTCFPAAPSEMAEFSLKFAQMGANIIGGCCGNGPAHIRAIVQKIGGMAPVARNVERQSRLCSRDRTVIINSNNPAPLVGERINPSGRKKFAAEITGGNFAVVRNEAEKQVNAGAVILDVNMGVPGENEAEFMRRSVQVVQSVAAVPLSIDSIDPAALQAGLEEIEGKPIINSVTAEDEKLDVIIPLAKKYGAALIGLPIDEKGIPSTAEGRLKLGEKILNRALQAGIPREDLYFDGLALAVSAEESAPIVTLETIRLFKERLGVKTVLGVSNVSFGLPGRAEINASFLLMALHQGLDLPIVNPYSEKVSKAILSADLLMGRDPKAKRFLSRTSQLAEKISDADAEAEKSADKKLYDAVLFGNREEIIDLLDRVLKNNIEPIFINDHILVPAMMEVGKRYDRKQFFLPQVIMAAEAMHAAFNALKPHLPVDSEKNRNVVLLATVKGDVHDIGKNIVKTMLDNHGYKVIDLGKNVSTEDIITGIERENADIVGLSALMTTTMMVMKEMVSKIREATGVKIIIGGAVVTRNFAEEIGADGYGKDATEAVKEVEKILSKDI